MKTRRAVLRSQIVLVWYQRFITQVIGLPHFFIFQFAFNIMRVFSTSVCCYGHKTKEQKLREVWECAILLSGSYGFVVSETRVKG